MEVEWVEFGPGAFIEYDVAVFLQKIRSDIDVLVYPGQRGTGTLGYGKDTNKVLFKFYVKSINLSLLCSKSAFNAHQCNSSFLVRRHIFE